MKGPKVPGKTWKQKFGSPVYLISFLVIIVLLFLGAAFYKVEEKRVKNAIFNQLSTIARLQADEIKTWLDKSRADAEETAGSKFFAAAVLHFLQQPTDKYREEVEERLKLTAQVYGYSRLMILDREKRPLLAVGEEAPEGAPASFSTELKEALAQTEKSGEVSITDLHFPRPGSRPHLDIVAAIYAPQKAEKQEKERTWPEAYLILTAEAQKSLFPLIESWPIASTTGETLLVKKEGDEIVFLSELKDKENAALIYRRPLDQQKLAAVRRAFDRPGPVESLDYRGQKVMAFLSPVPGTSWYIVSKIDRQEALSIWQTRAALIILLLLAVTVAGLLLIRLFHQRREKTSLTKLYQAETEARESQELFRVLTESSLTGVYLIQDGVFKYVNQTLAEWFGYKPEELIGKLGNIELTHPDDRPRVAENNRLRLEKKVKSVRYDFKGLRKDGSVFYLEAHGSTIDYQGRPAIIGSLVDITERMNLLQEIMAREAEIRATLYSIGDGVIATDLSGRVQIMNPVAEKLTGWAEAEAKGRPIQEVFRLINEFSRQPEENPFDQVIREGSVVALPNYSVLISRDGKEYSVADSGAPIIDNNGVILGVILVFRDQTAERKIQKEIIEAREQLKERNRFLEHLIASLPGMIYRCRNDRHWTMEYIAGACREITGYEPEDLINNRRLAYNDLIFPEHREFVWKRWQEAVLQKETFEDEYKIRTADGKIKWVWERGSGVYDEEGNLLYLEGFITDITERKKAEEELVKSDKEKSAIFATISEHVLELRPDLTVVWANRAAIEALGGEENEVIGRKCYELWFGRDEPCPICPVLAACQSGQPERAESITPDGRWWHVSAYPLKNEQGETTLIIEVSLDITDRKKAEEAMKQSLQEKEILLKEVHHRVKNNLQVISSILNLQSALLTDPQARAAIRECQHRIKSMALVHEKLYRAGDLARIDLAGYLSSLAKSIFLEHQVNSDRIKLHLEIEPVDLDLNVAVPLGLILNELITNAFIHAFPEGREGNIWVSFKKRPDGLVELRVKDDGVGFPSDVDFKKSESLGLVIINTLVEQIEGQLEMKRGEKEEAGTGGPGTEFCLTFKG